jgi:hypothetical protein
MVNYEEHVKVRSLTGAKVGELLVEQYNKIAILALKDELCTPLASSMYSKIIEKNKNAEIIFISNLDINIQDVLNFQPEAVVILMGRNLNDEKTINNTIEIFKLLKENDFEGDIILHTRIYKVLNKIKESLNNQLKSYLEERVYAYKFDLTKGLLQIVYTDFESDVEEIVRETPILFIHNELVKITSVKKN